MGQLTDFEASLARMSGLRTDGARASASLSLVAGAGPFGSVPRGRMVVVSLPLLVIVVLGGWAWASEGQDVFPFKFPMFCAWAWGAFFRKGGAWWLRQTPGGGGGGVAYFSGEFRACSGFCVVLEALGDDGVTIGA